MVGVADPEDATVIVWKTLRDVLPDYWLTAFPDEVDQRWLDHQGGSDVAGTPPDD